MRKRQDIGGARRLVVSDSEPCPTIMAVGIGSVNTSQYVFEPSGGGKPDMTKPPYRVPSMKEIEALPWNGFSIVSTFSGCGGSCLGFEMAGYKVLWASEFIPAAQDVYRLNHPKTILDTRDIRKVRPEDILAAIGKRPGELDVFEGSPPCASFSTAGKREAGWGKVKTYSDSKQRTDDLFFEYARILKGLRPKVFIAENVSGLIKGTAKGYFLEILAALKACGYRVKAKVLDASWLGVPQARQRLIFVGVRDDLGLEPAFPKPMAFQYTVRDALLGVSTRIEPESDISRFAIAEDWERLGRGEERRYPSSARPNVEKPCPTITCTGGIHTSAASVYHPTEKRKFSIAELKRICAFPDDFQLVGTYAQQWERLGRAVPPVMMAAIAKTIREEILCKIK